MRLHYQIKNLENAMELESHQVLMAPLVTEKTSHFAEKLNVYAFKVHNQANKVQIKKAVEELFDVRVEKVRTQTRHGKPRRFRFKKTSTPNWKKAIVELHEDDRISFV